MKIKDKVIQISFKLFQVKEISLEINVNFYANKMRVN